MDAQDEEQSQGKHRPPLKTVQSQTKSHGLQSVRPSDTIKSHGRQSRLNPSGATSKLCLPVPENVGWAPPTTFLLQAVRLQSVPLLQAVSFSGAMLTRHSSIVTGKHANARPSGWHAQEKGCHAQAMRTTNRKSDYGHGVPTAGPRIPSRSYPTRRSFPTGVLLTRSASVGPRKHAPRQLLPNPKSTIRNRSPPTKKYFQ